MADIFLLKIWKMSEESGSPIGCIKGAEGACAADFVEEILRFAQDDEGSG
jgi:hypothetical protein